MLLDKTKKQLLIDANAKALLKSTIQKAVDTIRVVVGTNGFDGNEISQTRLDKASRIVLPTGVTTITWRTYDNIDIQATQGDLLQAFTLATVKQSELWFCKTEADVLAIISADAQWLAKYNKV
jgi:hypothetical protein